MTAGWVDQAACRGTDPELFFPLGHKQLADALAVCRSCPVQGDCLDDAVRRGERGVWGGTTDEDRRRMRAPHLDTEQKRCSGCGQLQPRTVFYKDPNSADGRRSDCKTCFNSRTRRQPTVTEDEAARHREVLDEALSSSR